MFGNGMYPASSWCMGYSVVGEGHFVSDTWRHGNASQDTVLSNWSRDRFGACISLTIFLYWLWYSGTPWTIHAWSAMCSFQAMHRSLLVLLCKDGYADNSSSRGMFLQLRRPTPSIVHLQSLSLTVFTTHRPWYPPSEHARSGLSRRELT